MCGIILSAYPASALVPVAIRSRLKLPTHLTSAWQRVAHLPSDSLKQGTRALGPKADVSGQKAVNAVQRAARTCELAGFGAAAEIDSPLPPWQGPFIVAFTGVRGIRLHLFCPSCALCREVASPSL